MSCDVIATTSGETSIHEHANPGTIDPLVETPARTANRHLMKPPTCNHTSTRGKSDTAIAHIIAQKLQLRKKPPSTGKNKAHSVRVTLVT